LILFINKGRGNAQRPGGAGGGMLDKVEQTINMDLNRDGRIGGGGGMGNNQQYNQYGGQGYPPNNNQQYNEYGGQGYPPNNNQFGGGGFGQNPQQGGGGGGGFMGQLENMTGMDFNGDGRVGNSGQQRQQFF
jgi:hypothetical protein